MCHTMRDVTATRLLESIAAERLISFSGAGLSVGSPSDLPTAAGVAQECTAKYRALVGRSLPDNLSNNVELIAQHFRETNQFESLFIEKLIPWAKMSNARPNSGHDAIADLLGCGAFKAGVTANYDCLVEDAAKLLGEPDFQAILRQEDIGRSSPHNPYLKIHGCLRLGASRLETVWCQPQLESEPLRSRKEAFLAWLQTKLLDCDILIVGFWSDWSYLTELLATTITAIRPRTITLVDPDTPEALAAKAPKLWAWAHSAGVIFHHERESGATFLRELRAIFSRAFLSRAFADADETYRRMFGCEPSPSDSSLDLASIKELYELRRDMTGTHIAQIVRNKNPQPSDRLRVALHRRLVDLGAHYSGYVYEYDGRRIRLVTGNGRLLSDIRQSYETEPSIPTPPDEIVCVGAHADPSPANYMRPDEESGILRGGLTGTWKTHEALVAALEARVA